MTIQNMFSKPIDRDIKGVIKVGQDDTANVGKSLKNMLLQESCKNTLRISFQAIKWESSETRIRWASGFQASLEAVNLIS